LVLTKIYKYLTGVRKMFEQAPTIKRCTRCLMPLSAPGMVPDNDGLCPECQNYTPVDIRGEAALRSELNYPEDLIREYDCVVPISGGLDSVYTAFYLTHRMGLRCLGVHYDHGLGSESKPRMLAWIEKELGMSIVVRSYPTKESKNLVRYSIRATLPFGAKSMQAALCRQCGYGIRASVFNEMVKHGLHSVWGKHTMDHIPFRYCQEVKPARFIFQRNGVSALRSLQGRYRQARVLPSPGTSVLKLMLSPMGYPSLPKSHTHLRNISFYQYIPWNKQRMLNDLQANGVDIQPLKSAHSDCKLPPVVDRVLQSAWTVGKMEIYICNLVRDGQLTKEEGLQQIQAVRESSLDTSFLIEMGLSENEIAAMFL
jgi:hypothetical protein